MVVIAAQEIGLLLIEALLHQVAQPELAELGQQISLPFQALAQELVDSSLTMVLGGPFSLA